MGNEDILELTDDQVSFLKSLGYTDPITLVPLNMRKSEESEAIMKINDPIIKALLEAPFPYSIGAFVDPVYQRLDEVVGKGNWSISILGSHEGVISCTLKILDAENTVYGDSVVNAVWGAAATFGIGRYKAFADAAMATSSTIVSWAKAKELNSVNAAAPVSSTTVTEKVETAQVSVETTVGVTGSNGEDDGAKQKRTRRTKAEIEADKAAEEAAAAPAPEATAKTDTDVSEPGTTAVSTTEEPPLDIDNLPADYDPFAEAAEASAAVVPQGAKPDPRAPADDILAELETFFPENDTPQAAPAAQAAAAKPAAAPAAKPAQAAQAAPAAGGAAASSNNCVECGRLVPGSRLEQCKAEGIPPLHPKCVDDWNAKQQ